jgi:hypothetical protein
MNIKAQEVGFCRICRRVTSMGRCIECDDLVCEAHGAYLERTETQVACSECEEIRLDQFLNDHDLDGPRAPIVITPLQVAMLLDMGRCA